MLPNAHGIGSTAGLGLLGWKKGFVECSLSEDIYLIESRWNSLLDGVGRTDRRLEVHGEPGVGFQLRGIRRGEFDLQNKLLAGFEKMVSTVDIIVGIIDTPFAGGNLALTTAHDGVRLIKRYDVCFVSTDKRHQHLGDIDGCAARGISNGKLDVL